MKLTELGASPVLGTVPDAGKPTVTQTKTPPRVFPLCHPSGSGLVLPDPSPNQSGLSDADSVTAVSLIPTSAGLGTRESLITE